MPNNDPRVEPTVHTLPVTLNDLQELRAELRREIREVLPATQNNIGELASEMREGFRQVNARLDKQNGRIGKNEDTILILQHDAEREERERLEARQDARQDKQMKEWRRLFQEYVQPVLTLSGIGYLVAKSQGWLP